MDQCFKQGNQSFCQFITRRAGPEGASSAGSLDEVDSGATNSGGLKARGLDFTLSYAQDLDKWGLGNGRLTFNVSYTHLLDGYIVPLPGSDRDPFAGEVGAAKDRFFTSVNYANGPFSMSARGTYIGASYLDDQFVTQFDIDAHDPRARVGAEFYLDLQARFQATDTFEFFVGADNVLNNEPPAIISGLPGNTTGAETDAGTYDAIGRRFYTGVKMRF